MRKKQRGEINPAIPLKESWEKYARERTLFCSPAEATRRIGFHVSSTQRLENVPEIQARIAYLAQADASVTAAKRNEIEEHYWNVLRAAASTFVNDDGDKSRRLELQAKGHAAESLRKMLALDVPATKENGDNVLTLEQVVAQVAEARAQRAKLLPSPEPARAHEAESLREQNRDRTQFLKSDRIPGEKLQ